MTEETPTSQVPLLDLAPKLKRPLSLWNPLDYLLLLYWVFYFPQAIRWYAETFCESDPELNKLGWRQRWKFIKSSPRTRQIGMMGIFIAFFIPILICLCLQSIGIRVYWNSIVIGISFGVGIGVFFTLNVDHGVFVGVLGGIAGSVTGGVASCLGVDLVTACCMAFIVGICIPLGFMGGVRLGMAFSMAFGILTGVVIGIVSSISTGTSTGISNTVMIVLVTIWANLRPDDRLLSLWRIPRSTPLIIPRISSQLRTWLDVDWHRGLMNANQLLKYSQQFVSVDDAINEVLSITPSSMLIDRVAILSDIILDWEVLGYTSASFMAAFRDVFSETMSIRFLSLQDRDRFMHFNANRYLRFDTPAHVSAAGFYHLRQSAKANKLRDCIYYLSESVKVFDSLRHIEYGEEMYHLVRILHDFIQVRNIQDISNLNSSTVPKSQSFRNNTWFILKKFTLTIDDSRLVCKSISRTTRSFAINRALGLINEILSDIASLPAKVSRVERPLIKKTAILWRQILLDITGEIGQIEIDNPISNPYKIGDPVLGNHFVGREDILRQLQELWIVNASPQSVILYGHRRMGKTSILRNTTNLGSQVRVAYINLLSIGSAPNGIIDILMAICDAVQEVTDIPAPNNNDLFQFPENTFRRHLQHIEKNFTGTGLIIALDEFEKIEELIDAGKLSKDFLGFLRGMVQMSSKLAFAFAGLHTLQEMNADYFQPFYASFIPISVAFLTREATHQVLANPDPEFLLEYEPTALDHIYDLTNGQPYLTQLIGFQLVRMFNDYVFEQGKPRDRTFTIDDVLTICSGENFFTTGINYFNGVWQQAAEGATYQQEILKALAPHPQGLTESELISQTNLPSESLQTALKTLKDHDVIRSQKTNEMVNWAIAVELFRTWVVKYKLSDT